MGEPRGGCFQDVRRGIFNNTGDKETEREFPQTHRIMEEHMKWHDAIEVAVRIKHLEEKCNSLFCKVFGLNQRRMFIIKRLWIDSMENRDAYGYEEIGVVQTKDEADRIRGLEYIPKSKYPWPLDYAYEFKGDNVPRFIAKEITSIS